MNINLYNAQLENLYIHKVGNRARNEQLFLSQEPYELNDEIRPLLKEFFLKPFREKDLQFHKFSEESTIQSLFGKRQIFEDEGDFVPPNKIHEAIAYHLYSCGNHPHIKTGELYICKIENILINNEKVFAIGIFKSEVKQEFIQFEQKETRLDAILKEGVNLNKLDKGAIITLEEEPRVLFIDSNRYDTKYWIEDFLGVEEMEDSDFHTKKYLKFCENFAKDVVRPAEDKQQEIMFMNRAVNHFASHDEFQEDSFLNEVLENPELVPEFSNYKAEKGAKYKIEDLTEFPISNTAVTTVQKKLKSLINLDTNIQIKLNFINPESAEKFIEKGWDDERQMYYYLVYFNKEEK
ncbi:nucleoid-associated protein [Mesonia mobilis]|uniref:nucleoid-associated protein n=1 Tax=Mesonia mobilis TaxID=369791 RepID=UPI0024BA77B8|nr:nucleoid-associated protein [Mesonia mobilis]